MGESTGCTEWRVRGRPRRLRRSDAAGSVSIPRRSMRIPSSRASRSESDAEVGLESRGGLSVGWLSPATSSLEIETQERLHRSDDLGWDSNRSHAILDWSLAIDEPTHTESRGAWT